jgi:N-acetylmuramoyl-L-alanine amidase
MKISYDYGHMEGGQDGSADGILYEYRVAREYGKVCIDYLTKEGVTCIDCTPPDEFMSLLESLDYRVNKANENVCDLHISFHANWYYGKGEGAEIEVYSEAGREKAFPV